MRVLLAAGDREFLQRAHSFLAIRGHDVQTAADGLACLQALQDFSPQVVVLDSGLLWGGSDGVFAVLRDDSRTALTIVILVDHAADTEDDTDFSTIMGRVSKPCVLSELLTQIEMEHRPLKLATT